MTDFELIVLGFFGGIFTSIIMIGVGVAYDTRICKRKLSDDPCVCSDVSDRDRDRIGNNRCDKRVEYTKSEVTCVLYEMQRYACKYEKGVINYVLRLFDKGDLR